MAHRINTFNEEDTEEQIRMRLEHGISGLGNSAFSFVVGEDRVNEMTEFLVTNFMEELRTTFDLYFDNVIKKLPKVISIDNCDYPMFEIEVEYLKTNQGWYMVTVCSIKAILG